MDSDRIYPRIIDHYYKFYFDGNASTNITRYNSCPQWLLPYVMCGHKKAPKTIINNQGIDIKYGGVKDTENDPINDPDGIHYNKFGMINKDTCKLLLFSPYMGKENDFVSYINFPTIELPNARIIDGSAIFLPELNLTFRNCNNLICLKLHDVGSDNGEIRAKITLPYIATLRNLYIRTIGIEFDKRYKQTEWTSITLAGSHVSYNDNSTTMVIKSSKFVSLSRCRLGHLDISGTDTSRPKVRLAFVIVDSIHIRKSNDASIYNGDRYELVDIESNITRVRATTVNSIIVYYQEYSNIEIIVCECESMQFHGPDTLDNLSLYVPHCTNTVKTVKLMKNINTLRIYVGNNDRLCANLTNIRYIGELSTYYGDVLPELIDMFTKQSTIVDIVTFLGGNIFDVDYASIADKIYLFLLSVKKIRVHYNVGSRIIDNMISMMATLPIDRVSVSGRFRESPNHRTLLQSETVHISDGTIPNDLQGIKYLTIQRILQPRDSTQGDDIIPINNKVETFACAKDGFVSITIEPFMYLKKLYVRNVVLKSPNGDWFNPDCIETVDLTLGYPVLPDTYNLELDEYCYLRISIHKQQSDGYVKFNGLRANATNNYTDIHDTLGFNQIEIESPVDMLNPFAKYEFYAKLTYNMEYLGRDCTVNMFGKYGKITKHLIDNPIIQLV
jgi:hypothetical protein